MSNPAKTEREITTVASAACPLGECDGSGQVKYIDREPEDTRRPLGEHLYAGPATTHGSELCKCRSGLEPRPGEARWWTSKTIFDEEWTASVFDLTTEITVRAEVPVSEDNYIVEKRGNRYYPTLIDFGTAHSVFLDEARELARLLIAAADACDAYDEPDTDEGGAWWFPEPEEEAS